MSRVPDDDLYRLVNDPIETALIDGASVESMAAELIALRACRAQDTPSDPAARDEYAVALTNARDTQSLLVALIERRESLGMTREDVAERVGLPIDRVDAFERLGADPPLSTVRRYARAVSAFVCTEVAPVRAPGAVAAAPTESPFDFADVPAQIAAARAARVAAAPTEDEWSAVSVGYVCVDHPHGGEPDFPEQYPAPSAGEDEAAVERAARALHYQDYPYTPWAADSDAMRTEYLRNAEIALAAARGPRTQDDTREQDRA